MKKLTKKAKSVKMYPTIWKAIREYKIIMGIPKDEALDGDEVDAMCKTIKEIINNNEGNI